MGSMGSTRSTQNEAPPSTEKPWRDMDGQSGHQLLLLNVSYHPGSAMRRKNFLGILFFMCTSDSPACVYVYQKGCWDTLQELSLSFCHVGLRTGLKSSALRRVFCQLSSLHIPDLSSGSISLSNAPYTSCWVCGADVIRLP